ncbi:hypothetical protein J5N97_006627 [Dioscorea zingiberensis]|uniref:Late embryogenesis abundant protein n=1 Tax=Dioscorea zingiberensis TaxID=325984 RepID=A0A9D5DAL3_9LILI|nr:hypothetical protein J5N97_006627 [Dioscorea zingiberensis]
MSSRVLKKSFLFLRRYAVAAAKSESATVKTVSTAPEASEVNGIVKKEISWMREPKTGNWMPEDRFQEIDYAELRAKLLSKK